jgi:hypothetical protein
MEKLNGSLGLNLEESGRQPLNGRIFSLQKEQLGTIRFIPIKLTQRITGVVRLN